MFLWQAASKSEIFICFLCDSNIVNVSSGNTELQVKFCFPVMNLHFCNIIAPGLFPVLV